VPWQRPLAVATIPPQLPTVGLWSRPLRRRHQRNQFSGRPTCQTVPRKSRQTFEAIAFPKQASRGREAAGKQAAYARMASHLHIVTRQRRAAWFSGHCMDVSLDDTHSDCPRHGAPCGCMPGRDVSDGSEPQSRHGKLLGASTPCFRIAVISAAERPYMAPNEVRAEWLPHG